MNKVMFSKLVVAVLVLTWSSVMANAQGPPRHGPPRDGLRERERGPDRPGHGRPGPGGPPLHFIAAELGVEGRTVKGAPFSATAISENVQTLADGTRIVNKTTGTIYRDSEGRTRREQTLNFVGSLAVAGEPPQLIFINDVVAGAHYVLDQRARTGRKMPLRPGAPPDFRPPDAAQAKTESLGKQIIEGVEAEGTRSTVTIPVGQIGNDRPIEIVSERWEAPGLKVVVLSRHKDPRVGEIVYRLTNINRSEPARTFFEVPADYTISEGRPDGPFGGPPPRRGKKPGEF